MPRSVNDNKSRSGGNAPVLKPGGYPARLVGVVFIGEQKQKPYKGKAKPPVQMVRLTYELSHEFMEDDKGEADPTRPRWFHEQMPVYPLDADRSKLTRRFSGFDPDGETDGVLFDCLGNACTVVIAHGDRPGEPNNPYINIAEVTPPASMPGYVQPELVNPMFYFDPFDEENCDLEYFRKQPEWLQKLIMEANDYNKSILAELISGSEEGEDDGQDNATGDSGEDDSDNNPY